MVIYSKSLFITKKKYIQRLEYGYDSGRPRSWRKDIRASELIMLRKESSSFRKSARSDYVLSREGPFVSGFLPILRLILAKGSVS